MSAGLVCIVTIHGVGFQHAPTHRAPGYADPLHSHLLDALGDQVLGDDPGGAPNEPRYDGPIYVRCGGVSPAARDHDPGLARLGTWDPQKPRTVDCSSAQLRDGDKPIAHIALTYADIEGHGWHHLAMAETVSKGIVSLHHYSAALGFLRMGITDLVQGSVHHQPAEQTASLHVRSDILEHLPAIPGRQRNSDWYTTLRQIEDDVATYVCRNDIRVQVRSFVREALIRLACRDDVDAIVINSHSNGTVVAFDVLHEFPLFAAAKIKGFITSGSPLRKYVDLFLWGSEVGSIHSMGPWLNFGDHRDVVADPLMPEAWQPGSAWANLGRRKSTKSLFHWMNPDTNARESQQIQDIGVDNMKNSSGGGLQAHNYWDNTAEVVKPLASFLQRVVAGGA